MEFVMRRQSDAIRSVDKVKQLVFESGSAIRAVVHMPHVSEHDELYADEARYA